jgi:hypothetical protein
VPGLSIEEVFKRVRLAVRHATTGQQTPWESSSLTGDFYFSSAKTTTNASESTTTTGSPQCFAQDAAMASTDRQAHYQWANARDGATLAGHLTEKIALLFTCPAMDVERLSNAFAQMSVIVAQYVPDAHCFGGDAGVVATHPASHKSWGVSKGATGMRENLQWKVAAAFQCLNPTQQAAFYADVSVIVAHTPAQ